MAVSIPNRAQWQCSMHRAVPAPTASPRRRRGECFSLPLPATISVGSISRPAPPRSWSRLCPRQGARRVWSDSRGGLWITGWNGGDLFRYDSKSDTWKRWHLPSDRPQPYAVYVDDTDAVWVSDWGANAILRFDPKTERGSNPFLYPTATPACGSLLVAKARFGGPNPRPTSSS